MSTAIIVDLALLCIILIFVIVGLCRGLFRSIMNLVKSVLAFAGAAVGSKLLQPKVTELVLPIFKKKILSKVIAAIPKNLTELSIPELQLDFSDLGVDLSTVSDYLDKVRSSASNSLNVAGNEAYTLLAEKIEDSAELLVATGVRAILFLMLFIILGILLGIFISIIDNAFELPIIKTFNKAGGALLGLVEALLIICVSVYALKLLNLDFVTTLADGTVLFSFFYNSNLLSSMDFLKTALPQAEEAISNAADAVKDAAGSAAEAVKDAADSASQGLKP